MAFAGAGRAAMAGVKLGFVDDIEPGRFERDHQFFANALICGHAMVIRPCEEVCCGSSSIGGLRDERDLATFRVAPGR